jgi:hypothetical protein
MRIGSLAVSSWPLLSRASGAADLSQRVGGNYIIRIYGRSQQNSSALVGVVEVVDSGAEFAFHGFQELWNILINDTRGIPRLIRSPGPKT